MKVKTYSLDVLDRAKPRVYGYMGRAGELPLAAGHAVAVYDDSTGGKLYDSAVDIDNDKGVFATGAEAHDHAKAWLNAQLERHQQIDALKGDRRDRLLSRWDEIDAEEARINERIDSLKASADHDAPMPETRKAAQP